MSVYGRRTEPAYPRFDAPDALADNDHILVWWIPEYDDVLRQLVHDFGWGWPFEVSTVLGPMIPPTVMEAWKRSDPKCQEFAHYNVLMHFAIARARRIGAVPREPQWRVCSTCNERFIESSLPAPVLKRVGSQTIDCCSPCYEKVFYGAGSDGRSADEVLATLRTLSTALGRTPQAGDLQGPRQLSTLDRPARVAVVRALLDKPTRSRIDVLFGSWKEALAALVEWDGIVRNRFPAGEEDQKVPQQPSVPIHTNNTHDPFFWRPLDRPASGNITFVLVGGPMHYIDLRGEHSCFSGTPPAGGPQVQLAENVARVQALIDSQSWMRAAIRTTHDLLTAYQQATVEDPWAYTMGYTTGWARDFIKEAAGRPPAKRSGDALPDRPRRGRWLQDRDALAVLRWARADAPTRMVATPTVALWRWPDRSDLILHAFCDTLSARGSAPLTVVLPDVPHFRSFARRYNKRELMTHIKRTLIESEMLFPEDVPSNRGIECYGRHRPTLIVLPNGHEVDGAELTLALQYLGSYFHLRLTPWQVLKDPLLRMRVLAGMSALCEQMEATAPWTPDEQRRHAEELRRSIIHSRLRPQKPRNSCPSTHPQRSGAVMDGNERVALDPRRFFTTAEVTAVWVRQGRRCADCGRDVPRDLVEGDHIVPWTSGGRTKLANLQVLCVACNRRKGHRSGSILSPSSSRVASGTSPLRHWQRVAIEVVLGTSDPLLIEACPGAGKTRFALEAAVQLVLRGEINRVLVIAPTIRIVEQWVEAASGLDGRPALPFAPAGWRPTQPLFEHWCGAAFTYQSLYSQSTMFEALAAEPGYRTLVIFDEVHHVGTDSSWGIGAQQAFMHAANRILSLSGTAFRTKDPIVFVQMKDGRSVSDFRYEYGDALEDGACRPVRFVTMGGNTKFQTPSGQVDTVSFDDDLNERGESYRLRTALMAGGGHLEAMLDCANQELVRLRATGDPDAAGLVVCMDCDHADAIAGSLARRISVRPSLACSRLSNPDDPAPGPALDAFTSGSSPWLVAVRMVSEGVDIRRLRVVVYATNVVAELAFRQIIGRVVRTDPSNVSADFGQVLLPSDPRLLAMADRVREEAPARIQAPLVVRDPRESPISLAATNPDGEFQPISSTGEVRMIVDVYGRSVSADLVAAAERYVAATESEVPPFELALAAASDEELRQILLSQGQSSVGDNTGEA